MCQNPARNDFVVSNDFFNLWKRFKFKRQSKSCGKIQRLNDKIEWTIWLNTFGFFFRAFARVASCHITNTRINVSNTKSTNVFNTENPVRFQNIFMYRDVKSFNSSWNFSVCPKTLFSKVMVPIVSYVVPEKMILIKNPECFS